MLNLSTFSKILGLLILVSYLSLLGISYTVHFPIRLPSVHPNIVASDNESLSVSSGLGKENRADLRVGVDMEHHDTFELLENGIVIAKVDKRDVPINRSYVDAKVITDDGPQTVTSTNLSKDCTYIRDIDGEWTSHECIINSDKLPSNTDIAMFFSLVRFETEKGFVIDITKFLDKKTITKDHPFIWVKREPWELSVKFDSGQIIPIVDGVKAYHLPLYLEKNDYLWP